MEEISSVINFEKGFFYTMRVLFISPGISVQKFIKGERNKIVKPIIFLIICSLLYTIAQQFWSFEAGLIQFNFENDEETPLMFKIYEWFSKNYGYANILMAIFIAFWINLFFKSFEYNYFETYVLLCFIMGNSILISTLFGVVEGVFNFPVLGIGILFSLIYSTWAIAQFFDRKNRMSYLKGFLGYIFGILSSLIFLFILGIGIEKLL